jgi:hypothetical protein
MYGEKHPFSSNQPEKTGIARKISPYRKSSLSAGKNGE